MTQTAFVRNALRLLWLVLGGGLVVWIVAGNFPPDGRLVARVGAAQPSGFVGGITPTDRARVVGEPGSYLTEVISEPAYFQLARPRLYPKAKLRLRFRNEGQPIVELGGRTSLEAWGFDLRPLDAPLLDRLALPPAQGGLGWSARQDGVLRAYEKKATSRAVAELLASPDAKIGVYHADPVRWGLRLAAPKSGKPVEVKERLSGPRVLYAYVHRAPFSLMLDVEGAADAAARVRVLHEGETIMTRELTGSGTVDLGLTNAKIGLYRVEVSMPTESTLAEVRSEQPRLVFADTMGERFKAFSPEAAFVPEHHVVTWETDVRAAGLEAVVAAYRPPETDAEGWKVAEAEFDLNALAPDRGRIQMALSLPAIKAVGGRVLTDWIEVEYVRPPLSFAALVDLFRRPIEILKPDL